MTTSDKDKAQRIDRIRGIVLEDFERISGTEDPFVILDLTSEATWDEAAARYERYERFYRAENFQRLGDMDLTRKALDIRRAVGRSIVEIQTMIGEDGEESEESEIVPQMPEVDPNSAALGDIYFRDGLTFLKLGDLQEAVKYFRRSCDYDPTEGLPLAYLAYTTFRQRMNDPEILAESRRNMAQALRMDGENADLHVLAARFHIKLDEDDAAEDCIDRVEEIDPGHPKLRRLRNRLNNR